MEGYREYLDRQSRFQSQMDLALSFIVASLMASGGPCGPVVISEVMFHPLLTSTPDEFVEIVNLSAGVIDLTGWRLADRFSTDDLVGADLLLDPGQAAVIFEGDYDPTGGIYAALLPADALVLSVDDLSIGNGLANAGDSLFLINASGERIDSMGWAHDMDPGYSLEKILLEDCTLAGNWRISTQLHGTPGSSNSVAGNAVDLALDSLAWNLVAPPRGFSITAAISNRGLETTPGELWADGALVQDLTPLAPGESRAIDFRWDAPDSLFGRVSLTVLVAARGDFDTNNNAFEVVVLVPTPPLALVVNEIMYLPLSGDPEWVEVVSTGAGTINLDGWGLGDDNATTTLPGGVVTAGDYLVITGDSAGVSHWPADIQVLIVPRFPALNNSGDRVVLLDPAATLIDEVDYRLLPLTSPGRSLEKVSPTAPSQAASSWVSSPAPLGHTAGQPNSVLITGDEAHLSLEPNPLRLNQPESVLLLRYVTPFLSANLLVEIYDLGGRRLATVFNEGPVPGTGAVTWDARNVDPVRFKTGQYVLLFSARDAASSRRWERMQRLVLVR